MEDDEGYEWLDEARDDYEEMDQMRANSRWEGQGKGKGKKGWMKKKGGRDRWDDERDDFEYQGKARGGLPRREIPIWAACALTALVVVVLGLILGLCCLYKQHKKVMQNATTQLAQTGVPIPSPENAESADASESNNFEALPRYDPSAIKKMNEI